MWPLSVSVGAAAVEAVARIRADLYFMEKTLAGYRKLGLSVAQA
jgi:hypothetical protein